MRLAGLLAAAVLAGATASVIACQEPTQVTLDLRLATAKCGEVNATAIDVGVHPVDTEEKVKSRFPTAQTTDCDPSMAPPRIGTLVITPNDEDRAAIVVVAAYGDRRDPTDCQPPDYKNCVVARRQFSFSKHRRLYMPITIDPTCINVPCDAFSTCRKGFCFAAETTPCENDGTDCIEPGETANGGTNIDASVTPDAPSTTDGPPPAPSCNLGTLICGAAQCSASEQCCNTQTGARCLPATESCVRVCCTGSDCGGLRCFTNGVAHGGTPLDAGGPITEDGSIDDGGTVTDGSPTTDGSTSSDGSTIPPSDGSAPSDASTLPDGAPAPSLGICQ